jgi:site-specific recombinase XerD
MRNNVDLPQAEKSRFAGNSFEKYLQQKGLSKSTVKCYNTEALEFIVWCDIQNMEVENCTSTEIAGYLKHLQGKGQQNKTRNINLNILKHFFDWQIQAGQREDNPARHIKIRGTKNRTLYPIFTKQEMESIYHNYEIPMDEHPKSKCNWFNGYRLSRGRNKAIISLMIYQGLCTDEVNRLTLKDVKLKEGNIFIAGTRKSNERTLELKPHQIMELMEYQLTVRNELQKLNPKQTELYFLPTPSAGKKTITENDGTNIWKRLGEEIRGTNKKFINFQQVRASVITHWLKQHNLRQVQYMAGHRFISSTESYLVNQMEDLQSDIEMYHPIG